MSGDLRDLYQDAILDHYRNPRHHHALPNPDRAAEAYNPLCGDQVTVYLRLEDGVITEAGFQGAGCAISQASASMMTEVLAGKSEAEAEALAAAFQRLVAGQPQPPGAPEVGPLAAFAGVSEYPARATCASLAWHALRASLEGRSGPVSTE
jgi:nitrogen fixation NifU-like protein